jgi:hypothetical protein
MVEQSIIAWALHRVALPVATAVATAVACVACSGGAGNARGSELRADGTVRPSALQVRIAVDRESVAPGQSLQITIVVTNGSDAPRTLTFPNSCLTDYEFVAADGHVAGKSGEMCAQHITTRTLDPGAVLKDEHRFARGALEPNQPVAGTYQLRGVLLAQEASEHSAPVKVVLP